MYVYFTKRFPPFFLWSRLNRFKLIIQNDVFDFLKGPIKNELYDELYDELYLYSRRKLYKSPAL